MAENATADAGLGSTAPASERVLIVVPVFTHVEPSPFANFLAMVLRAARDCLAYKFDVAVPERKILHSAMNEVAEAVVTHGHAGMIVCDDDCFAPYDAIPRLLKHAEAGVDFVAGVGVMRGFPHTTTIGRFFPEGMSLVYRDDGTGEFRGFEWIDDISRLPVGLAKVDFCGVPIAWISRRALEAVERPWFGTHMKGGDCTHDVFFANRLRDAGIPVHVDTTLLCDHLAPSPRIGIANRGLARAMAAEAERGFKAALAESK